MATLPTTGDDHQPWLIAYGNLKGGVGKTTATWMSALTIARRYPGRVLAVNADPGSQTLPDVYRYAVSRGYQIPVEMIEWPTPEGFVNGVRAEMDRRDCAHLVIDVGGEQHELLAAACVLADELVIPTVPNWADMRRLHATLSVAAQASSISPVTVNILLNRVHTNPRVRTAQERRDWMTAPERGWPVLETMIPSLEFYARCYEELGPDLTLETYSTGRFEDVITEMDCLRRDIPYKVVDGRIVPQPTQTKA